MAAKNASGHKQFSGPGIDSKRFITGAVLIAVTCVFLKSAAHAQEASGLISLVLEGWRVNRALIQSGTGIVFLDFDSYERQQARVIKFTFDRERQRYEPFVVSHEERRGRDALVPDLNDENRGTLYIEYGEGSIQKQPRRGEIASIEKYGSSRSYRNVEIVPLDHLMGDFLIEATEKWEGSKTATEELVGGSRLIRLDMKQAGKGSVKAEYSVWVDPAKGYAVVREDYRCKVSRTTMEHQLEQLGSGAWVPIVTNKQIDEPGEKGGWRVQYRGRWTFAEGFRFNVPIDGQLFGMESVLAPGGGVEDRRVYPLIRYKHIPPPARPEFLDAYLDERLDEIHGLIVAQRKRPPPEPSLTATKPSEQVKVLPERVVFGSVRVGQGAKRGLLLVGGEREGIRVEDAQSSNPHIRVYASQEPAAVGDRAIYRVELMPSAPVGTLHERITFLLSSDSVGRFEIDLPVVAQITGPVEVLPAQAFLGEFDPRGPVRCQITLRSAVKWRPVTVRCDNDAVKPAIESGVDESVQVLKVTVDKSLRPGWLSARIVVDTDLAKQPEVVIPVIGLARPLTTRAAR